MNAVGLPRMWVVGLQPSEGWRDARQGGYARRHVVAASDPAHLDPQQAALDHVRRGRSDFRGATARVAQMEEVIEEALKDRPGDFARCL